MPPRAAPRPPRRRDRRPPYEPGDEAQVDFGLAEVVIGGERTSVAVFELRLSHSGVAVHVAFGSEGQEAFLEGHVIAFGGLGGVPSRIRYDCETVSASRAA